MDLVPFYGMALGTLGGLLMAWASVVKLREISENRYQGVMLTGTLLVFAGFLMKAAFILGKHYTFGILAEYGIALGIALVAAAIVELLRRRRKAN